MSKPVDWIATTVLQTMVAVTPRRLLGSLSWQVGQFVRQWQDASSDLRRNTLFERLLLSAAAHPWRFLMAGVVAWACIALSPLALAKCCHISLPLSTWDRSDLPTYFGTAWSVQATVVALVYPLVVSFVTLLLQRRATAKVALTAYMLETGVKPSGASSFALLVLMTLQYLALPWMSIQEVQAIMVANVAWLAVNLSLTGWFLARTAIYLQDERRVQTLVWLTQCVTLPREVRTYAMGLFLQNAQQHGWVPGADLSDESSKPKVVVFPMGEGRPVIQVRFSTPRELQDVHFKLVSWAVGRWMKGQKPAGGGHPLLELPCTPDDAKPTHVLCRVRDGDAPGLFARAAILSSYKLARPAPSPAMPFSSVEVMEELGREAASQIELRREPGFRQALSDLIEVHAGLLKAARFRSTDDSLDNVCLLQNPYGWGARPMGREWMGPYRAIAEATVACLEQDGRYFLRAAAISARLTHQVDEQPHGVLVDLMLSSTLLMYHLGLWWSHRAAAEPGPAGHAGRYLSVPLRNVYRDAVQGWIGSWETIYVRVDKDADMRDSELWNAHVARVKVYASHVDETARLLLAAVARGDAEAAKRLEDSLVKWWGGRHHEIGVDRGAPQPGWNLLTLVFADLSWEQAQAQIPELPAGRHEDDAVAQLLGAVLRRYWADVCMVTALVLLEHAADIDNAETSLCIEIVGALMASRGYDAGGVAESEPLRGAGAGVARLTRAQFADRAYSQRLDKIVERFRSDTRPPMTSGRIYSLSGAEDVDSLMRGQALYLVALAAGRHNDLGAHTRLVEAWRTDLNRLDRISRHFNALATEIRDKEFLKHSATLEKLREAISRTGPVVDAIDQASSVCEEARQAAAEAHEKTINDAPVDSARLVELAQRVHARVLSADEGSEFPVELTTAFEATDEALEPARQAFTGVSKLPYTNPPLGTMDDHRWFAQYMGQRVFDVALTRLQRKHGLEPIRDDHAEAFFADLTTRISSVAAEGGAPVVLVASGRRADYLSPYRLPEDGDVPAGVVIRPPETQERGLHAIVNGVAIYAVPMISSRYLVLPKEWLARLRFQRQQGGNGFSVEVTNEAVGKVDLTFAFACEFVSP